VSFSQAAILLAAAMVACQPEAAIQVQPAPIEPLLDRCGSFMNDQHVERYDGTLPVSTSFVDQHEGPVGKLLVGPCTGTLIDSNLMLTAGHCGPRVGDAVWFNYQKAPSGQGNRTPVQHTITEVVELVNDADHDYAIVRLNGAPGAQFGTAVVGHQDPPAGNTLITIIQHPDGKRKRVHAERYVDENPSYNDDNWFRHRVDTEVGSSGSGLLDSSGRIVGIHTNGGCNSRGGNEAMRVSALWEESSTIEMIYWGDAYCTTSKPCPNDVGDCDSDAHCLDPDARCMNNVGPVFGWTDYVDVCVAEGELPFPGWAFCDPSAPCDSWVGDCDSDLDCAGGAHCIDDVGDLFGWLPTVDVCVELGDLPYPGAGRCTATSPCDSWVGPCSSDDQCKDGRCLANVGDVFGWSSWTDVCVADLDMPFPGNDYCTPSRPCASDLGGCDSDDDCISGTVCDLDSGAEYGFASSVDVCTDRFPRILVRREGTDPTGTSHLTASCSVGTGEHPALVSLSTNGAVGTATPFGEGADLWCRENTSLAISCGRPGHTGTIEVLLNGVPEKTCTGVSCSDTLVVQRNDVISCKYDDGSLVPIDLLRTGDWMDSDAFDMSGTCDGGNIWVSIHELAGPAGKTIYCPAGDDITVTCAKISAADDMQLSLNGVLLDSEGSGAIATAIRPVAVGDRYTCSFTDD